MGDLKFCVDCNELLSFLKILFLTRMKKIISNISKFFIKTLSRLETSSFYFVLNFSSTSSFLNLSEPSKNFAIVINYRIPSFH